MTILIDNNMLTKEPTEAITSPSLGEETRKSVTKGSNLKKIEIKQSSLNIVLQKSTC